MARYRKKPIEVEAYKTDKEIIIHTLEGDMKASVGDYIITGVKGEQYPCKPEIFEATYEITTANVVPKSEVEKIFEEIENLSVNTVDDWGNSVQIISEIDYAELKKKYTDVKECPS